MKVLGVLGEAELAGTHFGLSFGMEGMGVVTRIGPGVSGFTVGESCFVGIPGMARRYVTATADARSIDPGHGLTLEAHGSVVVFMTAHYALKHAARVQSGDWVLVAGGAGGVGMAAVQIAAKAGARVIATASTPQRAELLRTLGAEYVVDSRSLSAIEEVRQITGGHGADIVVNSAPGEAVLVNLEVAAEFGRVVEVGKTEIFGGRLIDLAVFNKNLSLISIDLDRMMAHRKDLATAGIPRSARPDPCRRVRAAAHRILPVSQLADAFDQVARSTHLGRIVLDFTEPAPPVKPARPVTSIRSDAAYLVTGGLGDFGLATAAWLAAKGAGTIVLAGRRGAASADQQAAVEALRASGADVRVEQVDVADRASVDALLVRLAGGPPLRGVFHAAGVIADEPLGKLSQHGLNSVLSPKARGAFILQRGLGGDRTRPLRAVQLGDQPRRERSADQLRGGERGAGHSGPLPGEPRTTGAVGELGIARWRHGRLQQGDLYLLGPERPSSAAPGRCLRVPGRGDRTEPDPGGDRRHRLGGVGDDAPAVGRHPETRRAMSTRPRAPAPPAATVRAELAAMPVEQRVEMLTHMLVEQVAGVLGIPGDSVDGHTPLPELGLDSLMAVELRARINVALDVEILRAGTEPQRRAVIACARLADQLAAPR